jgi:uncharacterized protein YjiS (DUF1127 family)
MQFSASLRLSAIGPVSHIPALHTIGVWRCRLRHREALASLAKMGPHILEDVGLNAEQVEAELRKPFWKG